MSDIVREAAAGEGSIRGSQKSSHAARAQENRMFMSQGRWVFSAGVIILLVFTTLNRFATFINYYYIREFFVKLCLLPEQAAIINSHIIRYYKFQLIVVFVPAILADNYIRKEWVFKTMVLIGSFGSVVLCYLATISAIYSYSDSFPFKEDLFVTFISFQSLIESARPVFLTLLLDQLVNLNDFTADTSKIFSCFYLSREFCRLAAFALAVYTSTSKSAAAKGQIISPVLTFSAIIILILITYWKYPLISYPPHYHGIFKILGRHTQRFIEILLKTICRLKTCKHCIEYSESSKQESQRFWNILLFMLCITPHYYSVNIIAEGSVTRKISSDDPQQLAVKKVYGQCMVLAFLIISQFVIFPMMYRTKLRKVVSSPMRCMITSYEVVGACGLIAFVIICVNQHSDPALFHTEGSKVLTLYNMLNNTVDLELLNTFGGDLVTMKPYARHVVILESDRIFKILVRNKKLFMDDYHELPANKSKSFALTMFGLEEIPISTESVGSAHETTIFVFCLMLVCRGSVSIDCNDRHNRVELHNFAERYPIEVDKHSKCQIKHDKKAGPESEEDAGLQITASESVYNVAAVEDQERDITMKLLSQESKPVINLWTMLPIDLMSSWANMVFEISFYQFILIEAPRSCRTIILAVAMSYQILASVLSGNYLLVNGLYSERNGIIFFACHLACFVWFLTRMPSFNTAERIKELYNRESENQMKYFETPKVLDKKQKTSIASGDTHVSNLPQS